MVCGSLPVTRGVSIPVTGVIGASVRSAQANSNVTTRVNRVSGRGKPTEAKVAMGTRWTNRPKGKESQFGGILKNLGGEKRVGDR